MIPLKQLLSTPSFFNPSPLSSSLRFRPLQHLARLLSIPLAVLACDMDEIRAQEQRSKLKDSPGAAITQWWNGTYATGDWMGARTFLEDHGLKLGGNSTAIYYGVPTNDLRHNSVFCYNLILSSEFDFGKMFGLKGLTGKAGFQWATGETFRDNVGTGIAFSPIAFTGYWKWRLRPIVLTYVTPELFGIKEFLTLAGGWQSPTDYFILQPYASLFQNYAFYGGPLVANNILFDGDYVAWGGCIKVKPTHWSYVQGGLWAAVPNALDWRNRGIYFALAQRNGLFFMGETGVTPQFGRSRLPGKYAFGSYYWGLSCPSFFGATYPGQFGFYWQADQMLYREPTSNTAATLPNNDIKKSVSSSGRLEEQLSSQGLYGFSLLTYAPKFNNMLPFFLRLGLVYQGLIPTRDQDKVGIAFAYGNYSYYKILANRAKGIHNQRTNEALLEVDYRIQINKWLFTQPFLEYIMRPNGDSRSKDALVLGIASQILF